MAGGMADIMFGLIEPLKKYYIPFAMHFYGLVYAVFMKDIDPERCQKYIDRALLFGKNFVYWFAENGTITIRRDEGNYYKAFGLLA